MSYGAETIKIHKNLRLDKRKGSTNWYARLTLANGKRVIKSTGTDSFEDAKEHAMRLYYETQARIANKLPASTRKFKAVAEHTIQRMQADEAAGVGKQAYRDYTQALRRWLIPYFGATDIAKVDLAGLTAFDQWRTKELGRVPAQSTINNHNAALNRVLNEAELRGWITKSLRPTLLNKGVETQSRGSYTVAEYTAIVAALRTWHTKTDKVHAKATRNVLRNYVLFLANTGIRHGTEALGLKWKNIEWHTGSDKEPYLRISVYGKTKGRQLIARDRVKDYLHRQSKLNPKLAYETFDALLAAKSDEYIWTTELGGVVNTHNLNAHFNALLDELGLKTGADGKPRTLYSLRHFYITLDLQRGMSTHKLSKQVGNSTTMIDKHYSKISPTANADEHSGRAWARGIDAQNAARNAADGAAQLTAPQAQAFAMLRNGTLTEDLLVATLGADSASYVPTEALKLAALMAKEDGKLSDAVLKQLLSAKKKT
jgi:integrase